jgi:hypothetical protein
VGLTDVLAKALKADVTVAKNDLSKPGYAE